MEILVHLVIWFMKLAAIINYEQSHHFEGKKNNNNNNKNNLNKIFYWETFSVDEYNMECRTIQTAF